MVIYRRTTEIEGYATVGVDLHTDGKDGCYSYRTWYRLAADVESSEYREGNYFERGARFIAGKPLSRDLTLRERYWREERGIVESDGYEVRRATAIEAEQAADDALAASVATIRAEYADPRASARAAMALAETREAVETTRQDYESATQAMSEASEAAVIAQAAYYAAQQALAVAEGE